MSETVRKFSDIGALRPALAALLTLALTACNSLSLDTVQRYVNVDLIARVVATADPVTVEATVTPPPPDYSTAALVKLRSRIRVGIRFDAPPLSRVNDQGELEGFDVDLARQFARRWLGSDRNVEFVQVTSNSAPGKVRAREVDLAMGGIVQSRAAELEADFSMPYLQDGDALLVRTGTFSDFASLAGRPIVYIDDASTFALRDAQNANGVTVTTKAATTYAEAYGLLSNGDVDGMAGRWRRLRTRAAQDPALFVLSVFKREPVAIALPPGDSEWADLVNITLSNMMLDGTYARLYQQWFGAPPDPAMLAPLLGPVDLQLAQLPDALQTIDRLAQARATNRLRVAYASNPPFSRLEENNLPGGFEVELSRAIGARVMGSAESVEFLPLAGDAAQAFAAGTADLVIGGLPRTQTLDRVIDFSTPIYRAGDTTVAIGLPQRQSPLRDAVNLALQQMIADGSYAEIYARWFPDTAQPQLDIWR